jgi:hypothetical protein
VMDGASAPDESFPINFQRLPDTNLKHGPAGRGPRARICCLYRMSWRTSTP